MSLVQWEENCILEKTKCIFAQPAELKVFTIHDFNEEMADYLVLNDKKKSRSVSQNFKQ